MISSILLIRTLSWRKDSHGQFDYETENLKKFFSFVESEKLLLRHKNQIYLSDKHIKPEEDFLLKITSNEKGFLLKTEVNSMIESTIDNIESLMNKIWYVLPSFHISSNQSIRQYRRNKEYILKENDIIKLGRVKFNVLKLKVSRTLTTVNVLPLFNNILIVSNENRNSSTYDCRYCLSNSNEDSNPLVSLCKCKGGAKYIHFLCVKHWISLKQVKQVQPEGKVKKKECVISKSFNFKSFNCEICKWAYPFKFKVGKKEYDLIDFDVNDDDEKEYLVLESLNQVKEGNNIKSIHVVSFRNQEDEVSLGRSFDSDIVIDDVSVSRVHAFIVFRKGDVYFYDNNSKFGSLVLMRNDVFVKDFSLLSVQVGRTYVEMKEVSKENKVYQSILKEREKKDENLNELVSLVERIDL